MAPINWYQVRHYVKWTLTGFTVLFFLVNIVQLLAVKQFYIKRYVELHLIDSNGDSASFDGRHKVFQVDEEIDLAKFNLTETIHANHTFDANETSINLPAEHRDPVSTLSEPEDDNQFSVEVKFMTGLIVAAIIVIEMLYCILYLYIISQKRFCSMLCFAILSLLSLLYHLQLHFTIPAESDSQKNTTSTEQHMAGTFFKHIDSLEPESLVNHITRSSLLEVALSLIETILSFTYSALLYKFPGRRRSQHHRFGFLRLGGGDRRAGPLANNGRLPNGHAVAIEMNSLEDLHEAANDQNDDSSSHSSSDSVASNEARQMADGERQAVGDGDGSGGESNSHSSPTDRPLIDGDSAGVVVR